ncbi:phytoene/squalene synthase family protein [Rhodohalobacter sp.]|uniref:phytoene/squalene synthase family protein n=1 Tax=Rhodohalobacter sp. TaxID=1974210 RepID=UPI002ACE3FAC|nr:squalene/phytoene synthase family protein [Rhodohalobacter sp.]MDZ7757417.1 squalene/phytoene synthase family protein [Rhodohalobacter sp.]
MNDINLSTMTGILKYPYSLLRPIYEKTNFHQSVITELDNERLKKAYSHCREITRKHAKTFYMATRFLPNHKQRSIFAIYGLCRYLDDLVDEAEDLILKKKISELDVLEKLEAFKNKLVDTYRGAEQDDPILIAFSDTLELYKIPLDLPLQLMDGVKTDLVKSRYQNFDELYDYSYKVASVVGLMTSEVFGYSNPKAVEHAVDLGIAMQLTNILRDIGEDLERNRIYLPQDELDEFGLSESDLFNHTLDERFISFMEFQIKRANDYYESSDKGISMLSRDSRLPVCLARENYSRILSKIEENNFNVYQHRAYLNSTEKLSMVPKVMYTLRTA